MRLRLIPLVLVPLLCPLSAFADASSELEAVRKHPNAKVAHELIGRAEQALLREQRLRTAGDATRAKLAQSNAETWAQAARWLCDLESARQKTASLEQRAHDGAQKLSRARATLEASLMREQSLRAETQKAPAAPSKPVAAPKVDAKP